MRVLVTRPEEDAAALVAALKARGHEALVEPMLTVAPAAGVTPPRDLDGVQALLFTSANGARAFARLSERRDLPVFAVGDASAEAARTAGFAAVESAGGNVDDLARLAIDRLNPADGVLYQAAANRLAGDLKGTLEAAGFTLRREILYQTVPVTDLSGSLRRELAAGQVAAATFFSPRTAETFAGLVEKMGLAGSCAETTALCFSEAVAEKLRGLDWRAVLVAERPNQNSLLARLDELAGPAPAPRAAQADDGTATGQQVIARFGGIRPMASKLEVAVSTVQGWRERGAIPARHHARVLEAARTEGLDIGPADLGAADPAPAPSKSAPSKSAPSKPPAVEAPAPKPTAKVKSQPEPKPESEPEPASTAKPEFARPPPRPEPSPSPPPRPKTAGRPETVARPESVVKPSAGRHLPAALFGALLVIAGAGGALLARDYWMPLVDADYGRGDDGAVLALERRLAKIESAATVSPPGGSLGGLEAEALTPLAGSLAALEDRVAALADSDAHVAALAERLDRLAAEMPEDATLAGASERIEDLAARVEDVAARPDPAPEIAALTQQVADLAAARPDPAPEIAALTQQVADLAAARSETETAANANSALSLSVLQLREALQGSGPFAAELGLLRDLAASGTLAEGAEVTALIAPLAPHAETGIPGLARLKADFPAAARAALIAARGGAGDGWWAGVVRRLSELVILRPVGAVDAADKSAGAALARAEILVRAGDLAAALDELAALQDPGAEAMAAWRTAAGARAAARQALVGLGRLLAARLRTAED